MSRRSSGGCYLRSESFEGAGEPACPPSSSSAAGLVYFQEMILVDGCTRTRTGTIAIVD